jgi:hypothetical protein
LEPGDPAPSGGGFFSEPLDDTTEARLVYQGPNATGVRILDADEVRGVRRALSRGIAGVRDALPDLAPTICPRGHRFD